MNSTAHNATECASCQQAEKRNCNAWQHAHRHDPVMCHPHPPMGWVHQTRHNCTNRTQPVHPRIRPGMHNVPCGGLPLAAWRGGPQGVPVGCEHLQQRNPSVSLSNHTRAGRGQPPAGVPAVAQTTPARQQQPASATIHCGKNAPCGAGRGAAHRCSRCAALPSGKGRPVRVPARHLRRTRHNSLSTPHMQCQRHIAPPDMRQRRPHGPHRHAVRTGSRASRHQQPPSCAVQCDIHARALDWAAPRAAVPTRGTTMQRSYPRHGLRQLTVTSRRGRGGALRGAPAATPPRVSSPTAAAAEALGRAATARAAGRPVRHTRDQARNRQVQKGQQGHHCPQSKSFQWGQLMDN